jgi:5-methylcytosine-specific restriction enzyme subunit McrC
VGYLESPTGESIEILPKTQKEIPSEEELTLLRHLLRRMLLVSIGLKPREAGLAHLERFSEPLHEWVMGKFLQELAELVRRGFRFDYQCKEEECRYIRGRLDMSRQLRQRSDRAAWFHVRHDVYSPLNTENRLLSTALSYVRRLVKSPDNWRRANELALVMADIPPYDDPLVHLEGWRSVKLMRSYDSVHPWCRLVLEKLNPQFQSGAHKGVSLLFPMEKLFESYVSSVLKSQFGSALTLQASRKCLVTHAPVGGVVSEEWFQLKPDMYLETRFARSVLDVKWKLLEENEGGGDRKYNISQADMYQLFAYGHKYLQGKGNMMLIYPEHPGFKGSLPKFSFNENLHLWVVPFDLALEQLVPGGWGNAFPDLAAR